MKEFFDWYRQQVILSGSKIGKAFAYHLQYEETFNIVLKDGWLVIFNNLAEIAIKSLVMGRKNFLFSQSYEGSKATVVFMSLFQTTKRHHLNTKKI